MIDKDTVKRSLEHKTKVVGKDTVTFTITRSGTEKIIEAFWYLSEKDAIIDGEGNFIKCSVLGDETT